jgi:hypothetical protein
MKKSPAEEFADSIKTDPKKIIQWAKREIKEYEKLIKLITKQEEEEADVFLKVLAEHLIEHLQRLIYVSGKKISDDEAENMMSNISMYVLRKRLKKNL